MTVDEALPGPEFIPLDFDRHPPGQMLDRAQEFFARMERRRSVRQFSSDPVPRRLIEVAIATASTAPSGAHRQPWTFVAVQDQEIKQQLRRAAEEEEREFYANKASEDWLEALAPLGTDAVKTHITDAPWVVVLFKQRYQVQPDGTHSKTYYATESCGIAAGLFFAAIHTMGLVSLPHTPSPMGFLSELLQRPDNEQAYLLMPVGFPVPDARVPDIARKPLDQVAVWR